MTARRPTRLALLISSLMAALSVSAAAQTSNTAPTIRPLAFVEKAVLCVRTGDHKNTPEEWYSLLRRAQLWSLLYGASAVEVYAKGAHWSNRPASCAADMKKLAADFQQAEAKIFASGWRKGRINPNAVKIMKLDPAYTAGWCIDVAQSLTLNAKKFPTSIGLNRKTEEGRKQIEGLLKELEELVWVMDDWAQETKAAPLQASNLEQTAGVDHSGSWSPIRDRDETDKAVLRLAGIPFWPESDTAKWPTELIDRMKLTVELGECRAAADSAKFALSDK